MRGATVLHYAPVAELGRTKINQQMAAGRVLCDTDAMELHRRWPADGSVACLVATDATQAN